MEETHKALKPDGQLIIVQPDKTDILAHMCVDYKPLISETIEEPELNLKKDYTYSALEKVIDEGLFLKLREVICPDRDGDGFKDLDDYVDYAYDVEDRRRFVSKIRDMNIDEFVIWEYYREHRLLLKKVS